MQCEDCRTSTGHLCQGDLFLCTKCELKRFPRVADCSDGPYIAPVQIMDNSVSEASSKKQCTELEPADEGDCAVDVNCSSNAFYDADLVIDESDNANMADLYSSSQNVDNTCFDGHAQDSCHRCNSPTYQDVISQVPNQDYIRRLDKELVNLPRDMYIEKLLEVAHDSEDIVTWYRSVLFSRARSFPGCPAGYLVVRKNRNGVSSLLKYARDCYSLAIFLKGDPCEIDSIFSKKKSNLNIQAEHCERDDQHSSVQAEQMINSARLSLAEIKSDCGQLQETIVSLR
jgi:hypothetical protein